MSMTKKRMSELRNLKEEALNTKLNDSRKELFQLRSKVASNAAPQNVSAIKQTKRTIARILTIINQKRRKTNKV